MLIVAVISVLFATFLFLKGWITNSQDSYLTSPDSYSIQNVHASKDSIQEFVQAALSISNGKFSSCFIAADSAIPLFSDCGETDCKVATIYPAFSDSSLLSLWDNETQDIKYAVSPIDFEKLYDFITSEIKITDPGSVEINPGNRNITWIDDSSKAHVFTLLDFNEPQFHYFFEEDFYLLTTWDRFIESDISVFYLSFTADQALSQEESSGLDRISNLLLGKPVSHEEEETSNAFFVMTTILYVAVGFAVFSLLQLFMYAYDLRKKELTIFSICGETTHGIIMHGIIHFTILLIVSEILGVLVLLITSYGLSNTGFHISSSVPDTILSTFAFHCISTIIFLLRLEISQRVKKVVTL